MDLNLNGVIDQKQLHIAVENNNFEMVDLLLRNSVCVDALNFLNETPLHLSVRSASNQIIQELINYRANLNGLSRSQLTPLREAIMFKRTDTAQMLLSNGVDINAQDNEGVSELGIAVLWNIPIIVQELIDRGARINDIDQTGQTLLTYAEEYNNPEMILLLLENGANEGLQEESETNGVIEKETGKKLENTLVTSASNENTKGIDILIHALESHCEISRTQSAANSDQDNSAIFPFEDRNAFNEVPRVIEFRSRRKLNESEEKNQRQKGLNLKQKGFDSSV